MFITNDIRYIGVNDHQIDLFEGQYIVPDGMAYNSYLIIDEKIAVMDTVGVHFGEEWLANLGRELGGRKPDYLIVQHVEPDHSANISTFLAKYPDATVVGNTKTFGFISQFYPTLAIKNRLEVKDGESLVLGRHTLNFLFAPMVHWPEVMVTYDAADKVLFSADGFGKFGALDAGEEDWDCEARRYYFGIVGKYGAQVQRLLKAAAGLEISIICPLHGPVLNENLAHYIKQYDTWSSYRPENEGVFVAYASIYGGTKAAAELLAERLRAKGCPKVAIADLARDDWAECVEDAFRYDRLVLASMTYNADILPVMRHFIWALAERGYQNRRVAFIENGSWAPQAKKVMEGMLAGCKNLTFAETSVTLRSAMNDENRDAIEKLADELCR
ncbi:FprA family A-type flavoprotein [bacterium]|nr:FprA family A-type flavoprotein [bacterium]